MLLFLPFLLWLYLGWQLRSCHWNCCLAYSFSGFFRVAEQRFDMWKMRFFNIFLLLLENVMIKLNLRLEKYLLTNWSCTTFIFLHTACWEMLKKSMCLFPSSQDRKYFKNFFLSIPLGYLSRAPSSSLL